MFELVRIKVNRYTMKQFYIIYKTTNLKTGQYYIGQHITNNLDDGYLGSGIRLYEDLKKFGRSSFKREILYYCDDPIALSNKENEILTKNVLKDPLCYNLTIGGKSSWYFYNIKYPKEYRSKLQIEKWNTKSDDDKQKIKDKISKSIKEHNKEFGVYWFGRHHSEETKAKMRASRYDGHGKNNSMYGRMWICNDETKESKTILKIDPIPEGWRKGRICKK